MSGQDEEDLLAVVIDVWERPVVLTRERFDHIRAGHPEVPEIDVKRTVQRADVRSPGNRPGVELLWSNTVGGSRWMVVVVAYEEGDGRVLTAYPSKAGPPEDRI